LCFEGGDELLDGHQGGGSTAALLDFNPAGLEGTRANGETQRQTNEIGVIELHPRTDIAVVEEHFDTLRPCLTVQALSTLGHVRGALDQGDTVDVVRCHGDGKADALLVVVLFDDTGEQTPATNAIAPHDDRFGSAIAVEIGPPEGLSVARAQFKDIADFYATRGA